MGYESREIMKNKPELESQAMLYQQAKEYFTKLSEINLAQAIKEWKRFLILSAALSFPLFATACANAIASEPSKDNSIAEVTGSDLEDLNEPVQSGDIENPVPVGSKDLELPEQETDSTVGQAPEPPKEEIKPIEEETENDNNAKAFYEAIANSKSELDLTNTTVTLIETYTTDEYTVFIGSVENNDDSDDLDPPKEGSSVVVTVTPEGETIIHTINGVEYTINDTTNKIEFSTPEGIIVVTPGSPDVSDPNEEPQAEPVPTPPDDGTSEGVGTVEPDGDEEVDATVEIETDPEPPEEETVEAKDTDEIVTDTFNTKEMLEMTTNFPCKEGADNACRVLFTVDELHELGLYTDQNSKAMQIIDPNGNPTSLHIEAYVTAWTRDANLIPREFLIPIVVYDEDTEHRVLGIRTVDARELPLWKLEHFMLAISEHFMQLHGNNPDNTSGNDYDSTRSWYTDENAIKPDITNGDVIEVAFQYGDKKITGQYLAEQVFNFFERIDFKSGKDFRDSGNPSALDTNFFTTEKGDEILIANGGLELLIDAPPSN
jgi:hypothetical protein